MRGSYNIKIDANKIKYDITIKRKYTILRGDSAKGKTYFHYLVSHPNACNISCKVPVYVMDNNNRYWKAELANESNNIYVIDEFFDGFRDADFYDILKYSDNYFILITRDNLYELPYSVNEIYTLSEDKKYDNINRAYSENILKPLYNDNATFISPDLIITEDSNSGFQFFKEISNDRYDCVAAGDFLKNNNSSSTEHKGGKSYIPDAILYYADKYKNICIVVDGAAFGCCVEDTLNSLRVADNKNIFVLMPESFEYLILKANIFSCDSDYINSAYDYADLDFFKSRFKNLKGFTLPKDPICSWEQYYTLLLICLSLENNTAINPCRYVKRKLNKYFLRFKNAILKVLKELDI